MLTIKVESTDTYIGDIISDMLKFSKDNNVGTEIDINDSTICVFPWDDAYDIVTKYENGYYE